MRVLQIIDSLRVGGAQCLMIVFAREMGKRQLNFEIFSLSNKDLDSPIGSEGQSLAVLEAMAAGLPVAVGDNSTIIREDCGVVVPPGDVELFAVGPPRLLKDSSRRAQTGGAGKKMCGSEVSLGKMDG